jgi:glycerate kinase
MLDEGMRRFASKVQDRDGISMQFPGAGAAGGLGAAFVAFLGGKIRSGIDIVLDIHDFEKVIEGADLIVTGEGRIDVQTFKGKVPSGVLSRAHDTPVVAVCGCVTEEALTQNPFKRILPVSPAGEPIEKSMDQELTSKRITACVRGLIGR